MSGQRKDGGPAFPRQFGEGMTLRDWFAGMALCGDYDRRDPKSDAEWAYKQADAMLAARDGEAS